MSRAYMTGTCAHVSFASSAPLAALTADTALSFRGGSYPIIRCSCTAIRDTAASCSACRGSGDRGCTSLSIRLSRMSENNELTCRNIIWNTYTVSSRQAGRDRRRLRRTSDPARIGEVLVSESRFSSACDRVSRYNFTGRSVLDSQ